MNQEFNLICNLVPRLQLSHDKWRVGRSTHPPHHLHCGTTSVFHLNHLKVFSNPVRNTAPSTLDVRVFP